MIEKFFSTTGLFYNNLADSSNIQNVVIRLKKLNFWQVIRTPTLLEIYILENDFHCNLVSLSTLYGVNSFLVPLITTGLASQLSPYLRGFLREASIIKYHTGLSRSGLNGVLTLEHQYLGDVLVSMLELFLVRKLAGSLFSVLGC